MKKGSYHTEEAKRKLSLSRLGKYVGSENSFYGKKHTEETKVKMREKWVERKAKGEKPWNYGLTKETDPRLVKAGRTQKETKSQMDLVAWNKGLTIDDPRVKSYAIKHSKFMKNFCSTPKIRERMRRIGLKSRLNFPRKNTSIEKILQKQLKNHNVMFKTDKPLLNITRVDVFIPPNICVYADGDYWHELPKVKKRDIRQTKKLKEAGYIVLRFGGSEIRESLDDCINQILEVI